MNKWILLLGLLLSSLSAQAGLNNISNQELQQLLQQGIPVIDIRRPEEWKQTGVVEGSHLMTFFDKKGNYDVRKWLQDLTSVAKKDEPFIIICRTGNRTGIIGRFLADKLAFPKVYNVEKGITHWIAKGNPVVK
ncbi:MAG: rhodanese-like domain-containing protein [Candidatus Sedimenticola sp. PURPLELP]